MDSEGINIKDCSRGPNRSTAEPRLEFDVDETGMTVSVFDRESGIRIGKIELELYGGSVNVRVKPEGVIGTTVQLYRFS